MQREEGVGQVDEEHCGPGARDGRLAARVQSQYELGGDERSEHDVREGDQVHFVQERPATARLTNYLHGTMAIALTLG